MKGINIGIVQTLTVEKETDKGFILESKEEEIYLPEEEVTGTIRPGDNIDVFVYADRKGNLTASMHHPDAQLDSYGWAEVVEVVKKLGVFVDIGVGKEMLVSVDDLPLIDRVWPVEGDWLFVSLEVDKKGRLLAKPIRESDVQKDLVKAPAEALHQSVIGRVYRSSKAGSFILTGEGYRGFIHPNERKEEPRLGQTVEGRIIDVKEDGTINISLLPLKQESRIEDAEIILHHLKNHNGEMLYTDKSDPESIRKEFGISKAAFKRALGKLIKEKKVTQKEGKTLLIQSDDETE